MKKIIGIIFISLMLCNIGFAEIKEIDHKAFKERLDQEWGIMTRVICIDGYVFVLSERAKVKSGDIGGVSVALSMVQFFEERNVKSLPAKC